MGDDGLTINDKLGQLRSLLHDLASEGGDIPLIAREYALQILPGSKSPADRLRAVLATEEGREALPGAVQEMAEGLTTRERNDLATTLDEAVAGLLGGEGSPAHAGGVFRWLTAAGSERAEPARAAIDVASGIRSVLGDVDGISVSPTTDSGDEVEVWRATNGPRRFDEVAVWRPEDTVAVQEYARRPRAVLTLAPGQYPTFSFSGALAPSADKEE